MLAAAFVTPRRHLGHGDSWISFAIGALAGTALLELVPDAWEAFGAAQGALLLLVLASACCFTLDRLFHCRQAVHPHTASCFLIAGGHEPPQGKRAWILLVGDFFHSLVDGLLIAAAFSTGVMFGVLMTGAIILHEIPRKCATTLMFVRFGRSRGRALLLATGSSLGILGGGAVAWGA
jgi:zinc and cadmium transporter